MYARKPTGRAIECTGSGIQHREARSRPRCGHGSDGHDRPARSASGRIAVTPPSQGSLRASLRAWPCARESTLSSRVTSDRTARACRWSASWHSSVTRLSMSLNRSFISRRSSRIVALERGEHCDDQGCGQPTRDLAVRNARLTTSRGVPSPGIADSATAALRAASYSRDEDRRTAGATRTPPAGWMNACRRRLSPRAVNTYGWSFARSWARSPPRMLVML